MITGTSSGLGFPLADYYLESGCWVYTEAAKIVSGGIEKALEYGSGIFVDVRNM